MIGQAISFLVVRQRPPERHQRDDDDDGDDDAAFRRRRQIGLTTLTKQPFADLSIYPTKCNHIAM